MKKRYLFPLTLFVAAALLCFPQKVIENPAEPEAKNAGRVLVLKEEFRITDEQGDFYFQNPKNIKLAPDGSLFIADEEQLLRFSTDGKFLKNLFRKGQGPGELERLHNYLFSGNEIVVFQHWPGKIVRMDMEGKLIREFKPEKPLSMLISVFGDRYIMAHHSPLKLEKKGTEPEIVDIDWKIINVSGEGILEEIGPVFPAKWFAQRLPGAMIANYIVDLSAEPLGEKWLVLHHDQDYWLELFDMESGKVQRKFGRKYRKVKLERQKKETETEKEKQAVSLDPPVDYVNDIQKLFVVRDKIMAVTSTIDNTKGILVDVFNKEGEYIDNFFLPVKHIELMDLSRYPITISGDFLLIKETDEDDFSAVVKYKIMDMDTSSDKGYAH
ncbi:MAG: 6-bladed beta-propeller [Candidatus Aminicenantes bacterium]|nr:MAG: 6-bladed beta-propeller [Candidatus Aminicenantes bacterium]